MSSKCPLNKQSGQSRPFKNPQIAQPVMQMRKPEKNHIPIGFLSKKQNVKASAAMVIRMIGFTLHLPTVLPLLKPTLAMSLSEFSTYRRQGFHGSARSLSDCSSA